jgi:hypothetical protein
LSFALFRLNGTISIAYFERDLRRVSERDPRRRPTKVVGPGKSGFETYSSTVKERRNRLATIAGGHSQRPQRFAENLYFAGEQFPRDSSIGSEWRDNQHGGGGSSMRPAGRQRSVIEPTTPYRPLSESLSKSTGSPRETAAIAGTDAAETEVILAPAAFAQAHAVANERERAERHRRLPGVIRERIQSRLNGRLHDLVVRLEGNTVVLEGQCATYYTKQLAQHAALGALEDEQLRNAIVVTM